MNGQLANDASMYSTLLEQRLSEMIRECKRYLETSK
jgi:hypothetical protein